MFKEEQPSEFARDDVQAAIAAKEVPAVFAAIAEFRRSKVQARP